MHLTDTLIQSNLQCIQAIHLYFISDTVPVVASTIMQFIFMFAL